MTAQYEYGVLSGESKTRAWLDELAKVLNEGWELVHFGPYNPSYNLAVIRRALPDPREGGSNA